MELGQQGFVQVRVPCPSLQLLRPLKALTFHHCCGKHGVEGHICHHSAREAEAERLPCVASLGDTVSVRPA